MKSVKKNYYKKMLYLVFYLLYVCHDIAEKLLTGAWSLTNNHSLTDSFVFINEGLFTLSCWIIVYNKRVCEWVIVI